MNRCADIYHRVILASFGSTAESANRHIDPRDPDQMHSAPLAHGRDARSTIGTLDAAPCDVVCFEDGELTSVPFACDVQSIGLDGLDLESTARFGHGRKPPSRGISTLREDLGRPLGWEQDYP